MKSKKKEDSFLDIILGKEKSNFNLQNTDTLKKIDTNIDIDDLIKENRKLKQKIRLLKKKIEKIVFLINLKGISVNT